MENARVKKTFRQLDTLVRPDLPIERYRQLAQNKNSRRVPEFYVTLTFAGTLFNLLMELKSESWSTALWTRSKLNGTVGQTDVNEEAKKCRLRVLQEQQLGVLSSMG